MPDILRDFNMLRCPKCLRKFVQTIDKSQPLTCSQCHQTYPSLGEYYNFYIEDESLSKTYYPPELEHLHFTIEKIQSLSCPKTNKFLNLFFRRHIFNKEWELKLEKLKNTVKQYESSEKKRVEFMVDDYTSEAFLRQKEFTREKAKVIMRYISSVKHSGNLVLHIGCGGLSNDAIPIEYTKAGFLNYGVDAVRSYVEEFLNNGYAHLANALALPYADETFDIINFTDILEHLFDPLRGLREANRVLKKGGYLMIDTPNRAYINIKNPFSWLEYYWGVVCPDILRSKIIVGEWEGETFLHTEFSREEINALLFHSGFESCKISAVFRRKLGHLRPEIVLKEKIRCILDKIAPTSPWHALTRKL